MSRVKIEDLSILEELAAKETRGIFGGQATRRGDVIIGDVSTSKELEKSTTESSSEVYEYPGAYGTTDDTVDNEPNSGLAVLSTNLRQS